MAKENYTGMNEFGVYQKILTEKLDDILAKLDQGSHSFQELKASIASLSESLERYMHDNSVLQETLSQIVTYVMQKHSITQELIDEGAFDVAKAYIDFLKTKSGKVLVDVSKANSKVTVSPTGKKTMKKNNGADFGPDTKGTKTSGLQEAIDKSIEMGRATRLGDEKDAGKASGE